MTPQLRETVGALTWLIDTGLIATDKMEGAVKCVEIRDDNTHDGWEDKPCMLCTDRRLHVLEGMAGSFTIPH